MTMSSERQQSQGTPTVSRTAERDATVDSGFVDELVRLADLRERELISEEEHALATRMLLGS